MNINFHFPFHQILHFELHYKKPGKFGCTQNHDVAYFTQGDFFRRVFEDSIDDIPSATAPIDEFNCCDVCKRKDEKFKYAQMYCVVCAKKLCDSHLKVQTRIVFYIDRIPKEIQYFFLINHAAISIMFES